jgi:hypothetical protein
MNNAAKFDHVSIIRKRQEVVDMENKKKKEENNREEIEATNALITNGHYKTAGSHSCNDLLYRLVLRGIDVSSLKCNGRDHIKFNPERGPALDKASGGLFTSIQKEVVSTGDKKAILRENRLSIVGYRHLKNPSLNSEEWCSLERLVYHEEIPELIRRRVIPPTKEGGWFIRDCCI